MVRGATKELDMSVAKIIEVNASSKTSIEDAVRSGIKKVAETVKGIQGAWINETKVVTDGDGNVTEWRVNLRITFLVQ
jgi:flavin-binding protein dodecin